MRRLIEIIFGNIKTKYRLPCSHGGGRIYVTGKSSGMKYLFGRIDCNRAELLQIAKDIVSFGDVVWDVGANVGIFSCAASFFSGKKGKTIAFECDTDLLPLLNLSLLDSCKRHGVNMEIVPTAIYDRVGLARLSIAKRSRASNFIESHGNSQTGGVLEERTVTCFTLDALIQFLPPPNVLKIDVEGAEFAVLSGAVSLIDRFRPRIYCEISKINRESIYHLLKSNNYVFWNPKNLSGDSVDIIEWSHNMVAIPVEKKYLFEG